MKPIILYTAATPNGFKVSNMLEELKAAYGSKSGFDFETKTIGFDKNEQKSDWFTKICPNGRIPAITDPNKGGAEGFHVFETAAIILYLQEHYDTDNIFSFGSSDGAKGSLLKSEAMQWIFWVHGGVGPMQGQMNHFFRYAPETIPYAQTRYYNEVQRLYSVLDKHLEGRDWLVGEGKGKYSIADINAYPWLHMIRYAGLKDKDFGDNVKRYIRRNFERPAIQKGMRIPSPNPLLEAMLEPDFEEKHGEEIAKRSAAGAKWIREGNKQ